MNWFETWVNFKTRKQVEEEMKAYNEKVFPYGEKQKEKIFSLIAELIEKKDEMDTYNYLVIKQGLLKLKKTQPDPDDLKVIRKSVRNTLKGKDDKFYRFVALALCDLEIDERLEYPAKQEILDKSVSLRQA